MPTMNQAVYLTYRAVDHGRGLSRGVDGDVTGLFHFRFFERASRNQNRWQLERARNRIAKL